MPKKKKYIIVAWVEYIFFTAFEKIVIFLQKKAVYSFAEIIADIVFFFDSRHRNRTIQHIMHSGISANLADAKKLAKKNFRHIAAITVDTILFKEVLNTKEKIISNIKFSGERENIDAFLKQGAKQAIIVTAHYGNWEIAGIVYSCLSGRKLLTVMRQLDNPLIEKAVIKRRLGYGAELVSKHGSLKAMLRAIKEESSVCFIADQHARRTEGIEINFFGQPARAHKSPALLQKKTGLPIFVAVCERNAPLKYTIKIKDPIMPNKDSSIEDIVQKYSKQIEEFVAEKPEQWCWAHRRWLNINRKQRTASNFEKKSENKT